jgi:cation:H+ antiporter
MFSAVVAVIVGLAVLLWSADKFVEGASAAADYAGVSPLLIGMLIVGFGTSAPEFVVSVSAALNGNPSIAIGNAYGSNIVNIALILGLTALIKPIRVKSGILKKELPILTGITLISFYFIYDLNIKRYESALILGLFIIIVVWGIIEDRKNSADNLNKEMEEKLESNNLSLFKALFFLTAGLVLLIASSKVLVWGALVITQKTGISDLMAGLTIVAIGTSLPELASSLAAIKRGSHDIALGNVIGSNMFNTLGVTGTAFLIHPSAISKDVIIRDFPVMFFLTIMVFVVGFGFKNQGRINRFEGFFLLSVYILYLLLLIYQTIL